MATALRRPPTRVKADVTRRSTQWRFSAGAFFGGSVVSGVAPGCATAPS